VGLAPGTKLGAYEIVSPLGAGGMGEVYKARDRKLDRDVAVKVLPQTVANDPESLARFEREAKAVAALSHPNILAIYARPCEGSSIRVRSPSGTRSTGRCRSRKGFPPRTAEASSIGI